MKILDLTLDDPFANVALDEALLENAEIQTNHPEVLRLWEPNEFSVVIGRSSPIDSEVNLDYCQQNSIPVIRRASGGASIVTGPGCLMYAVLLSYERHPELRMLERAHEFVMGQMQNALARIGIDSELQGTCDLTIDDRKVSGNAMRCKRHWLIYHGTMICNMPLDKVSKCLGTPKRQPDYRVGRDHQQFVARIPTDTNTLKRAIVDQWECDGPLNRWPKELTEQFVREKYSTNEWNYKVR